MTQLAEVEIRLTTAADVRPLRRRVLRAGRPAVESSYPYDDLPEALHAAAFAGDTIVGVATVYPEPYDGRSDAWRLRGMAVDPTYQGRGVGSRVMELVMQELRSRGVELLWCNARTVALPFYLRHGFVTIGDEFLAEQGIPHYVAVLTVSRDVPRGP